MVAAAAAALGVALYAPLATNVIGLVTLGIVRNLCELRYVFGRFDSAWTSRLLRLLLWGISAIAILRVAALGGITAYGEILIGYGLLAVVVAGVLRTRRRQATLALVALGLAAGVSVSFPAYHFVALAHVHNVVPLVFLWEWARRIPDRGTRRVFRGLQVGWVLAVPLLVIVGVFDAWLVRAQGAVPLFSVDVEAIFATYTPPALDHGMLPVRFLAAFAFLQTMHYFVWCWFLPRNARDAIVEFERSNRVGRAVRGWRLPAIALTAAGFFAILFVTDYMTGRAMYGAVATYHAYLEFPVLLALLLGWAATPSMERS